MPFGTRLDHWLQLIRGEFQEVPDLRVTLEQAEVLWSLEPRDLELILETFVDVGFPHPVKPVHQGARVPAQATCGARGVPVRS